MPTSSSSSAQAARQRLADQLRELRITAGLSGIALAKAAGWYGRSKISKIEHGVYAPTADEIRTWCRLCQATEQRAAELIADLVAVDSMWTDWRRMERTGLRQAQESRLPLWERTQRFRFYSPSIIPGPLQTPPYIQALLSALRDRRGIIDDVPEAVAVRVAKQDTYLPTPRTFAVLLEEEALRHRVGPAEVMAGQLGHLRRVASLPSVSLGIIPFTADRSRVWPVEMFFIFGDEHDGQVSAELVSGFLTVTAPVEIRMYASVFADLSELAVHGEAARALIRDAEQAL